MWELDHEESWEKKYWCFWTVVLEKIPESPLDLNEIKSVHPKGNQSWRFIETDSVSAEAETPILWPPNVKNWFTGKVPDAGKDWEQKEKRASEAEMAGWHHWCNGYELEQTSGDGEGQGGLACHSPWVCKESNIIGQLNNTWKWC